MGKKNFVVAIVGMTGTGKSLVTNHINQSSDFNLVYFGGYILEAVRSKGLEINSENERHVREDLRKREGLEIIAKFAIKDINRNLMNGTNVVIDGLYTFSEYLYLKESLKNDLFIIAVYSEKKERYARLASREYRPLTKEEVDKRDYAEIRNLEKGGPIAIADFHLLNNFSTDYLYKETDKILAKIEISHNLSLEKQSNG